MKKVLYQKRKGSISDMLGTLVCIFIIFTLLCLAVDSYAVLQAKHSVNDYARLAILKLETTGELNATDLTNQIKSKGFSDVTVIVNNGAGKKNYGEEVSIEITINATPAELHMISNILGTQPRTISTKKISISKSKW